MNMNELGLKLRERNAPNHQVLAPTGSSAWIPDEKFKNSIRMMMVHLHGMNS